MIVDIWKLPRPFPQTFRQLIFVSRIIIQDLSTMEGFITHVEVIQALSVPLGEGHAAGVVKQESDVKERELGLRRPNP